MKEKIAFVCQRYGPEVNGGAELHCRQVAERLTDLYDVTVYTTCAVDYVTWRNEYPAGTEYINRVRVKRFRCPWERNPEVFNLINSMVNADPEHSEAMEEEWLNQQGPYCPELHAVLRREYTLYRKVFFMTYLYYTTAKGLPLGFENAMLIPTVHDEPPVYLRWYDKVFSHAKGIVWNTREERSFAVSRFPFLADTPGDIVGLGIEAPRGELPEIPAELRNQRFLVYTGRIDVNKGCRELFSFFTAYKKRNPGDLKLVLIGKPVIDIPEDPDIIPLGFVSEEMKFAVMKSAQALVLFSRFESLSMVVLESMLMGRPVLVTGHSVVLKEHCVRSNAGLYFQDYPEFEEALNYLLTHPEQVEIMRRNGIKYVTENFRWDVIVEKYRKLIEAF